MVRGGKRKDVPGAACIFFTQLALLASESLCGDCRKLRAALSTASCFSRMQLHMHAWTLRPSSSQESQVRPPGLSQACFGSSSTIVPIATQEFSIKVWSEVTWRLRAPVAALHRTPSDISDEATTLRAEALSLQDDHDRRGSQATFLQDLPPETLCKLLLPALAPAPASKQDRRGAGSRRRPSERRDGNQARPQQFAVEVLFALTLSHVMRYPRPHLSRTYRPKKPAKLCTQLRHSIAQISFAEVVLRPLLPEEVRKSLSRSLVRCSEKSFPLLFSLDREPWDQRINVCFSQVLGYGALHCRHVVRFGAW